MSTIKEPKTAVLSSYLTKGTIGNVGVPGAPIVHFSLVVSTVFNTVSGMIEIIQATDSKPIQVLVKGSLRYTGYGSVTKIVNLSGKYTVSVTPPAIGTYLQNFTAYLDIDNNWNGQGGFSMGDNHIDNVPVKSEN
jgi:hypothetical protein